MTQRNQTITQRFVMFGSSRAVNAFTPTDLYDEFDVFESSRAVNASMVTDEFECTTDEDAFAPDDDFKSLAKLGDSERPQAPCHMRTHWYYLRWNIILFCIISLGRFVLY